MRKGIDAESIVVGVLVLLLSSLIFAAPIGALSPDETYKLNARGGVPGPPSKVKGLSISIAYPEDGSVLDVGTHAVDVKAMGEVVNVTVTIDGVTTDITDTKSGDYYVLYPWTVDMAGTYVITAEATDADGNKAMASITVTIVDDVEGSVPVVYELVLEIDYISGHEPTSTVLDYIYRYYRVQGILVTFWVDDVVEDPTPYTGVTDDDFWAIESMYNDIVLFNDRAQDGFDADGDGSDYEYTLKEKWVLFGTVVEGQPNVVGYCYVKIEEKDLVAGNYIFIADETADNWSYSNGLEPYSAEATVLMHELGHSIGVGKLRVRGIFVTEVYDEDPFSVMSYLSTENAGLIDAWHYSNEYWDTRNMEYYEYS